MASFLLGPAPQGDGWNQVAPISALWQSFCNNIHPLTHIVHLPSLEQMVVSYSTTQPGTNTPTETLIFSICACAILSMDDNQSYSMLGRSQADASAALQMATRSGLLRDGFLTAPNLQTLQCFAFYIVSGSRRPTTRCTDQTRLPCSQCSTRTQQACSQKLPFSLHALLACIAMEPISGSLPLRPKCAGVFGGTS